MNSRIASLIFDRLHCCRSDLHRNDSGRGQLYPTFDAYLDQEVERSDHKPCGPSQLPCLFEFQLGCSPAIAAAGSVNVNCSLSSKALLGGWRFC
jgi:hypothetical protein